MLNFNDLPQATQDRLKVENVAIRQYFNEAQKPAKKPVNAPKKSQVSTADTTAVVGAVIVSLSTIIELLTVILLTI